MSRIKIDVVSDTVCPWCFVGKRRLERALSQVQAPGVSLDVQWLPYQLNPSAPEAGVNKLQYYNDKFGPAMAAQIIPRMQRTFEAEGLPIYSAGGMTGNTRNSHRLLAWAAAEHGLAKQNALAEALFRGYHCQEAYVNDPAFLLSAAEAAGLPRDAAEAQLTPDSAGERLVQQEQHRYAGISGVPHFVIAGRHHINGAQPPEVFVDVLRKVLQEQAPEQRAPAGSSP